MVGSFKISKKKPSDGGGAPAGGAARGRGRGGAAPSGRGRDFRGAGSEGGGFGRGGRGGGGRGAGRGGARGGSGGRGRGRGGSELSQDAIVAKKSSEFRKQQWQKNHQSTRSTADEEGATMATSSIEDVGNALKQDEDGFFGGLGRARTSAQGAVRSGVAEGSIWKPNSEREEDQDGRGAAMVPVQLKDDFDPDAEEDDQPAFSNVNAEPQSGDQTQNKVLWLELGLCKALTRGVAQLGFLAPTPVQCQAIPPALTGVDLCVRAVTGSGKTAAFLLPILHRLLTTRGYKQESQRGKRKFIRGIVLTPSRELGTQCHDMCRRFLEFTSSVETAIAIGGLPQGAQQAALEKAPELVIATPGRLCDLLMNYKGPYGSIDLSGVEVVAIDEVDKMLTVTLKEQVETILGKCPEETRQTMLFSATMTKEVDDFAKQLLVQPRNIEVGHVALQSQLKQQFIRVKGTGTSKFPEEASKAGARAAAAAAAAARGKRDRGDEDEEGEEEEKGDNEKDSDDEDDIDPEAIGAAAGTDMEAAHMGVDHSSKIKTRHLIAACNIFFPRAIIFTKYRTTAHRLAVLFNALDMNAADLQGNQTQDERFAAYTAFGDKKLNYLICTDIASRGLDIPNVEVVINYDMPPTLTAYIHRVGRTARVGTKGTAVSLVDETHDAELMRKILAVSSNVNSHQVATVKRRDIPDEALVKAAEAVDGIFHNVKARLAAEALDEKLKEAEKKVNRQIAILERGTTKATPSGGAAALLAQEPKKQWVFSKKEREARDAKSKETYSTEAEVRVLEEAKRELADVEKEEKSRLDKQRDVKKRKKFEFEKKKDKAREERRAVRKKAEAKIQKGMAKKQKTAKIRSAIRDKKRARQADGGGVHEGERKRRRKTSKKETGSKQRTKNRHSRKMKKH